MSNAAPVRVAVNGYGDIGKRVADAVALQPDMHLLGVADVAHDFRVKTATARGVPVYAASAEGQAAMRASGIAVAGSLDDLLRHVEVIVDCTPAHVGATNVDLYHASRVKAVFQGGEKHALTGHSFVAQANYETALDRPMTRVVSCNTTSTIRTLVALRTAGLFKKGRGVLIRRATDPWESDHTGIMNTVVPEPHIPSHQGPDAQSVVPDLDVVTIAAKAAHTMHHSHFWTVELTRQASSEEVLAAFRAAPRIAFIRAADGLVALNSTIELMKDLGRPRGDMWEVALWEDILTVQGNEAFFTYDVHNEAIVVPENIDAIRALIGRIRDGAESIRLTDQALGIRREFLGGS